MLNLFYRDKRLLALVVCLILVSGLSSIYVLPRLEDPVLTERAATVNTRLPGASPERVESLVTEKIEEELQEIEEIKEIRSISRLGISTISIELKDNVYESDQVWSRVRDQIDDAAPLLPAEASEPDFEIQDVKAYALILALSWAYDGPPNYAILSRWAERLEDALRGVPGTETVDTFGDPGEEITVKPDPHRLAQLRLSAADLASQLSESDAKVAAGLVRSRQGNLILEVDGELDSLERVARTPIRLDNTGTAFVSLADIATIEKGIPDPPSSLAIIEGEPAVALAIFVQADRRIDQWTRNADEMLQGFRETLPPGLELRTVFTQTTYVEARLTDLVGNLLLGGAAVVAVIFVMMGGRAAFVVGMTLPLASLMVIAGMRILEIPVHQMSVTGLIIALGLLIDNAIIMVDEVNHFLHEGHSPPSAVARTVRRMAVPLAGSTFTTALAFAPIALMPGPAGEFVGSIAISVILAIFSSLMLALTVTPAMAALLDRGGSENANGHWWSHGLAVPRLTEAYRGVLHALFTRPWLAVALGLILPLLGFWKAGQLTEQFFPPADRDQFQIELELPTQATMAQTRETVLSLRERLLEHPRIEAVDWFLGESAPSFYYNVISKNQNTPFYAQALVKADSKEGTSELIDELQRQLDREFPSTRPLVRQLEQGPPFEAPIEVRVFGPDLDRLREMGREIRAVLASLPKVTHTRADLSEALPKIALKVDEEEARLAGLSQVAIARQLDTTLEGALGGSVLEEIEELPVRVRVGEGQRTDLDRVASLGLMSPALAGRVDAPVASAPLSALAEVTLVPDVAAIARFNGQRMNEVKAFLRAGTLPAETLTAFQEAWSEVGTDLPPGYRLEFAGEAAKRDDAVANLLSSVSVLAVLMAATLVLSFGSFRMAGTIGMVGFLSAGLGMGSLWLFEYPFGFMAIVGTMGLIGVAINDSIVVLAALRENQAARQGQPEAVRDVVHRATRHVLATTFTTVAGFAPLVLGGGGFWPPLAVTIACGVFGATLLALIFSPSVYILSMCRAGCREQPAKVPEIEAEPADELPLAPAHGKLAAFGFAKLWPTSTQ